MAAGHTFVAQGACWLLVAYTVVAAMAGCGNEEPPDVAVAMVGDKVISQEAVQRAVVGRIAIEHSTRTMPPYLPGQIEACIAAGADAPATGSAIRAELRRRCERERDRSETAALRFLIRGLWYRLELERRGEALPQDQQQQRAAVWAGAHAGVKPRDVRDVSEITVLRIRATQNIVARQGRPSEEEIAEYHAAHRTRYYTAATREGLTLQAATREQAEDAASLMRQGRSAAEVAASDGPGGLEFVGAMAFPLHGTLEEQRTELAASQGKIMVETPQREWMVYRVHERRPPVVLTLEQARVRVEGDVQGRHTREAIARYEAKLRDRYQEDTVCADDHHVPECK